jgi:glycosyltransferase involved in cell wall biosynthesis
VARCVYDLSLVICTRNRAKQLRRCLDALARQDYDSQRWQLLIVDNGSADDTRLVARTFAASVPFHVAVVDERHKGQARARNTGVRAALAPIIAFTDDDCYAAPDYVTEVVRAFSSADRGVGYIGGRILLHDPTDAAETIRTDETPEEIAPGTLLRPGSLHGANMAFRRSVWDTIGGFDPRVGAGTRFSGDDIDFLCRASLAGYRGAYRPEPVVRHHHGRKPGHDVAVLHRQYARGRGAFYIARLLRSPMRPTVARRWYWHLRTQFHNHRFAELLIELIAAAEYTARHAWTNPLADRVRQDARLPEAEA